jgi:two-component system OmpR family response regulator
VLRRATAAPASDILHIGDVTLDTSRMSVTRDDTPVELTPTEFQLLAKLAQHPGRIFTREQLLDAIGGAEGDAFDRSIDAHVKNIRRKLERDPRRPRYILTVYGVGYKSADA